MERLAVDRLRRAFAEAVGSRGRPQPRRGSCHAASPLGRPAAPRSRGGGATHNSRHRGCVRGYLVRRGGGWPTRAAKLWEPLPSLATSPRLATPRPLAPTRPRPHLVGCDGLELRQRNLLLECGHQRRGRVPVDVRHRHSARVRALAQGVVGVGSGGGEGEGEGEGDGEYGTRVEFGLQLGRG